MYLQKSFLSRLLGAAWTILIIAVLLWAAVKLLQDVWIWVVAIGVVVLLIRIAFSLRRLRRDQWWWQWKGASDESNYPTASSVSQLPHHGAYRAP